MVRRVLAVARSAPADHDPRMADGDGTVPRVSAIPIAQSAARDFRGYFVPEQHGALQAQSFVLADLVDRIKLLQERKLAAVLGERTRSLPGALSVQADDLYATGSRSPWRPAPRTRPPGPSPRSRPPSSRPRGGRGSRSRSSRSATAGWGRRSAGWDRGSTAWSSPPAAATTPGSFPSIRFFKSPAPRRLDPGAPMSWKWPKAAPTDLRDW